MSFKEYLISNGLTEEQATAVVSGMPEKKFYLASEEKLDERFDKMKSQKEQLEEQLTANQTELDTLKESAKGNEDLTKQLAELQSAFDKTKADSETKLAEQQKDFAIKLALKEAQALDEDIVLTQLDKDTIKVVDGKLQGFDEQLKSLQESKAFLFQQQEQNEDKPTPTFFAGGNPQGPSGNDKTLVQKIQERLGE
ncbi:phage scaffolding protein [Enterococcus songbeiensis]|uniref:phage scaffolding protein n=1 Tax=Enterococcus songbeiensis TaxID=2559927 RepID=UPI001485453A|nr:phage scaffolding protein [Enterococcus songbeiensis]